MNKTKNDVIPTINLIEHDVDTSVFTISKDQLVTFDISNKNTEESEHELMKNPIIAIRVGYELDGKALYLSSSQFDWKLVKDSQGSLCLIAIKK